MPAMNNFVSILGLKLENIMLIKSVIEKFSENHSLRTSYFYDKVIKNIIN